MVSLSALRDALVLLLKSMPVALVETEPDTAPLPGRAVGETVQARVVAELSNGRSVIDVGGPRFDVKLPVPARVGDTLQLEVLALTPRLTFAVSANVVGGAPNPVAMSESARRLAAVLQQLSAEGSPRAATAGGEPGNAVSSLGTPPQPASSAGAAPAQGRAAIAPDASSASRLAAATVTVTTAHAATPAAAPPVHNPPRLPGAESRASAAPAGGATSQPGTAQPIQTPPPNAAVQASNANTTPAPMPTTTPPAPHAGSANPAAAPPAGSGPPAAAPSTALPLATGEAVAAAPGTRAEATQLVTAARPVVTDAPRDAAALAKGLHTALTRSGLFYESHQAQWVAGERALVELLQEPQAPLKPSAEPVHPQAVALVRQQLDVLDTRQLVWQGQVWPDQFLEWRIEEDQRERASAADAPPAWKTSLRLHLPRLGAVHAALAIHGDELRIAFHDLTADTRSEVRSGQEALRQAFEKAGLTLVELKVGRDET